MDREKTLIECIGRAYCTPENEGKIVDTTLADAIIKEIVRHDTFTLGVLENQIEDLKEELLAFRSVDAFNDDAHQAICLQFRISRIELGRSRNPLATVDHVMAYFRDGVTKLIEKESGCG